MRQARHILAVVAVTTALCADRAVSAAPVSAAPVSQMAATIVRRVSQAFRRTVAHAISAPVCRSTDDRSPAFACRPVAPVGLIHRPISPFQFRLPPPLA